MDSSQQRRCFQINWYSDWLDRIEKSLLEETVMDKQILNSGAFRTNGGFNAIDKRFGGKLQEIIDELNEYLYNDEENVA